MVTRIVMRRAGNPVDHIELYTDHCTLFTEPDTSEYRRAVVDGYRVSTHQDGVEEVFDE